MKTVITTIRQGTQSVQVAKVDGMTGYELDAVGKDSLPLAVELAVLQTQAPLKFERLISK